jgi:GEVED domain
MKIRHLRRVLAAAGVGALLVLAAPATAAFAQLTPPGPPIAPFPSCPNLGYQVQRPAGQDSTLGFFDLNTSTFVPIKNLGQQVNAIGYSTTQNLFWGMEVAHPGAEQLIRIDSVGNVDIVGRPLENGSPLAITTVTGAVDQNLLFLHTKQPVNHLVIIDVNPASPTFGEVKTDIPLSRATAGHPFLNIGDWDFNPVDGQLYSLEWVDGTTRNLVKINPQTGQVTTVFDLSSKIPDGQNFGADYVEKGDNILYVSDNDVNRQGTHNQTFSVNITTGQVIAFTPGPVSLLVNDGAGCLLPTDFGDAPDSYGTLNPHGGPGHEITANIHPGEKLTIGQVIDPDLDGIPTPKADGDDLNRPINDEDGVPHGTVVDTDHPTLTIPCVNTTGAVATLAGWIDFNQNGKFDSGERAMVSVPANATSVTLNWPKSSSIAAGLRDLLARITGGGGGALQTSAATQTFLRLRLYPGAVANPQPTGADFIAGGEVEDHLIGLTHPLPNSPLPVTGMHLASLVVAGAGLVGVGAIALLFGGRRRRRA